MAVPGVTPDKVARLLALLEEQVEKKEELDDFLYDLITGELRSLKVIIAGLARCLDNKITVFVATVIFKRAKAIWALLSTAEIKGSLANTLFFTPVCDFI